MTGADALVLAYHALEDGPPPLFIDPALFAAHLDVIAQAQVRAATLDQLGEELREGGVREPSVAITFDDGFASAAQNAAPLLLERGLPATIFCVAGSVGGVNDFPTDPAATPKRPLADAAALSGLAAAGFTLGSHGMSHLPLSLAEPDEGLLRREVIDSRSRLEELTGAEVRWFAYPYGSRPGPRGRSCVEAAYAGAVGTGLRAVEAGADPFLLPRVDAHYLRRPGMLRRALNGDRGYLRLRRAGARAQRVARSDYDARSFLSRRTPRR